MSSSLTKKSAMTRLKLRTAEWMNKQKKTVDSEFEVQNQAVLAQMNKIRTLYASCS